MTVLIGIQIWISLFLTLVVLSALFAENSLYRAVESYFIGLSTAILAYYIIVYVLYNRLALPLMQGNLIYLVPLLLALSVLFRKVPLVNVFSSWIVVIGLGIYIATISIHVFDSLIVRQLFLFVPLAKEGNTVLSFLTYTLSSAVAVAVLFHFSPAEKRGVTKQSFDSLGSLSLIVALGVVLGYTVASYIVLFVDRMYFLIEMFLNML